MRITRVPAKPRAPRRVRAPWRWREAAGMALATLLLLGGIWEVRRAKQPALEAAGTAISRQELLLLTPGIKANQIAPYLLQYEDARQRSFVAGLMARELADAVPGNVGALANIQVTRAEAESGGVSELLAPRFERSGRERVRLFSADEFARLKQGFAVRAPRQFGASLRNWLLLFFAAFWLVHAAWSLIGFGGDEYLLPGAWLLSGLGLILMVSLRDPVRDLPLFADYAGGVIAAALVLLAITAGSHFLTLRSRGEFQPGGRILDRLNEAARFAAARGNIAFALALLLSALLLLFGSGPGESGARVRLGFFQPVEVIRLLLVLFLASYFARRWEFLRELKEKRVRAPFNLPRLDHALPVMLALGVSIAFFFLQKDLGPAVVLTGLFLGLYAIARRRVGLVLAAAAVFCGAVWLAYTIGYPPIAVTRIGMWLEPWNNGLPRGEQVVHGLWAMATGGAFGTGLGHGQPEVIPAAHTDLVLAALAEETGFLGLLLIAVLFGFLFWRALRISLRAATDYELFLALGMTVALAVEGAFIAGGIGGLLPLSGVVTPFLSYGGTAMLANFAALGVLLAISAKPGREAPHAQFDRPVRVFAVALFVFGGVLLARAAWVQTVRADPTVAAGTLVAREDGSYALAYNPRLLRIARQIPRGSILDRTGLPLAASRWEDLEKHRSVYSSLGVDLDQACPRDDSRYYPFGPATFHLLGDLRTRTRWSASNASFEERLSRTRLQGFDDKERVDTMVLPRSGKRVRVLRYDYSALVPLLRARMDPKSEPVRKLLDAPRDVRLTVDARLQIQLTKAFSDHLRRNNWRRGAVVVLHPASGDLLAAVSVPLPPADPIEAPEEEAPPLSLDLARFGQYPPGSAFKLVTAIAALRRDPTLLGKKYECIRLPDGRVGNRVRGRVIRDDVQDKSPHGTVDLRKGLVVSCNAYFAQLGTYDVGAQQLLSTAQIFNIDVAQPNTPANANEDLPQAAYGQAQVLVTPYRMARVTATIANRGVLPPPRFRIEPAEPGLEARPVLSAELADTLQEAMRGVVTSGTGREAARSAIPIAGKTGTAELAKAPSHAWFTGFAPAGAPAKNRVAFSILVENARYGGRAAAPFAAPLVAAAVEALQRGPRPGAAREEAQ